MERRSKLASSLGAFLRTLFDLIVLNLLWIFCSLPIITIGPASSALCYVELKLVRDDPVSPFRAFFTAFKRDFRQSFVMGLLGLLGVLIAFVDFRYALSQTGSFRTVFLIVSSLVSMVVGAYWAWVFALEASYENTLSGTIKNAFSLAFVEPARTLRIWIAFAVPVLAFLFLPEIAVIYIGWMYLFFSVSAPAWFAARNQSKVFGRFEAQSPDSKN